MSDGAAVALGFTMLLVGTFVGAMALQHGVWWLAVACFVAVVGTLSALTYSPGGSGPR